MNAQAIPLNLPFRERIALIRKARSRELKATHPDVWDKCIRYAGAVAINHRLSNAAGADIEDALIGLADELCTASIKHSEGSQS